MPGGPPSGPSPAAIFTIGVVSVAAFPLLGPVAVLLANRYSAHCVEAGTTVPSYVSSGRWLGLIGSALLIASVLATIAIVGFMVLFVAIDSAYPGLFP